MYQRHLSFLILLALSLCLSTGKIYGQDALRSIYQDSEALSHFIEENSLPHIRFERAGDRLDSILMDSNGVLLDSSDLASLKYILHSFGQYEIRPKNAKAPLTNLRFRFHVQDTSITIKWVAKMKSINIKYLPSEFSLTSISFDHEADTTLHLKTSLKYEEVLNILGAHSEYRNIKELNEMPFANIYSKYERNPFIGDLVARKLLLGTSSYSFFVKGPRSIENFKAFFEDHYPWHGLLNGDSTLSFRKMVSYQDIENNYRTPIVTSKNELDLASTNIKQKNRLDNILDPSVVAVGLSDFIADRAQEELNMSFFKLFKKSLGDSSELALLFPQTQKLLYKFRISDYKVILSNAKDAFYTDLSNLGLNFPRLLDLDRYRQLSNSADIYNLALIYHITNLATQDISLTDILISAFQRLQERELQLDRAINLELGKLFASKQHKKLNGRGNSQGVNDLPVLQGLIENYCRSLQKLSGEITSEFIERYEGWGDYYNVDSKATKLLGEAHNIVFEPKGVFFANEFITSENALAYYQNTIKARLNGHEATEYLLSHQPKIQQFRKIFQVKKGKPEFLVAQGLLDSRSLIMESYPKKMRNVLEKVSILDGSYAPQTEPIKSNSELVKLSTKDKYGFIDKKSILTSEVIKDELRFWTDVAEVNMSDLHIIALKYLQGSLENQTALKNISRSFARINSSDSILIAQAQNEFTAVDRGLDSILFATDSWLDSIQTYLILAVDSLKSKYEGKIITNPSSVEKVLNTISNSEYRDIAYQISLVERKFAEEYAFTRNLAGPEIRDSTEHLDDYLYELYRDLNGPYRDEEIKSVKEEIKSVQEEITAIDNSITNRRAKKYIVSKEEDIHSLKNQKTKVLADNQKIKLAKKTGNWSIKVLHNKLNENTTGFLSKRYSRKEYYVGTITEYESPGLDLTKDWLKALQGIDQLGNSILDSLDRLAEKHYPKLTAARKNAIDLRNSLEIAINLLSAFRDFQKDTDSLVYLDTTIVTVTRNSYDDENRITGVTAFDSIQTKRQALEVGKSERWLSRFQFEQLRKNELQWNVFLGLIYQRINALDSEAKLGIESIALLTTKFIEIANTIDLATVALKKKRAERKSALDFQDYYPIIRSAVDLFNTVIVIQNNGKKQSAPNSLMKVPLISNEALSLYENILLKNYSNAVLNAVELLKILTSNTNGAKKKQRILNHITTYGTFMANLLKANTSEQVKNLLKASTLPPGSSLLKRETIYSASVNSYLGLGLAQERISEIPGIGSPKSFTPSLSVPIGLTFSWSPNFLFKGNHSLSLFVPILDIGAITAFRFDTAGEDYSVQRLPKFTWSNLLSPGAFLVYNIANSPFSIGLGGQYGPQLREINTNNGESVITNSVRWPMMFASFDVPLFSLGTGRRKNE